MSQSRDSGHFERLYRDKDDPWDFVSSAYEQAKYHHTLAALGERRFAAGLEVGCSIGVLSRMLAGRCERFLGVDIVEDPLAAARERCADLPGVEFQRMTVPGEWPEGQFDLIVFSEVLYFLSAADIDACVCHARQCLLPGGMVVLVNWLGRSDDPTPGEDAASRFIAAPGWRTIEQARAEGYRLDVLCAAD